MAIFDRNYDRDYGYRGGSGNRGDDRGLGDRMRHGWERVKEGARDAMDRDDDRGYGYRGGAYGSTDYDRDFGNRNLGSNNNFGTGGHGNRDLGNTGYGSYGYGAGGGNRQREGLNRLEGDNRDLYDRDSNWYAGRNAGMGMGGGGAWSYDREFDRGTGFGASDTDRGYDRDHKSRWQTDNGDPFGDRGSHTPIRMMRGGFRNDEDRGGMGRGTGYDADFGRGYGAGSNMGYDRDMTGRGPTRGLGYDPYEGRDDLNTGRGGWGMSNRNRGYDRGWF